MGGGAGGVQYSGMKTGGQWSAEEQALHINILELKACQLAIFTFCKDLTNLHVRIFMDNTTSCSYINKLGGKTYELDLLAREIWLWCIDKNIHISAAHLPGRINQEADKRSRFFNDGLEWSLDRETFDMILTLYPQIKVYLFATRLNHNIDSYVSLRPDPHALAVDVFSIE